MRYRTFLSVYQFLGPNGAQGFGNQEATLPVDELDKPYMEGIEALEQLLGENLNAKSVVVTNLIPVAHRDADEDIPTIELS